MSDADPVPALAALLREAGHDLPPSRLAGLDHGHALLRAALARLGWPEPAAEPATIFRPMPPR
jgi:hypothetical protein